MERSYSLTVYGATGFTGQFVAAEAFRTRNGKTIAIAGRNKHKLEKTLDFMKEQNGGEDVHSFVDIIIADSCDTSSILEMCRQSRVIVNCVGPYTFYGEQVVQACIEAGTHHVDISGEAQYIQMCQIKYHDAAKEKGIHIVSTCGFDSVPADVGVQILRENFDGELTHVDSFIHFYGSPKFNTGTYDSLVHAVAAKDTIEKQDKIIFEKEMSYVGPPTKPRYVGWAESEDKYFIPFMGPDAAVVKRTQLFESSKHGKTPITYHTYLTLPSIVHVIFAMIFGLILLLFTKFRLGVQLLVRFPRLFTLGTFSPDGPSEKHLYGNSFKFVFHGKGYSSKSESPSLAVLPDKSMLLTFKGQEPAYIYTSISMVAAANTLVEDQLLNDGGVLTPASAFRGTKFVDRLKERGVEIYLI